MDMSHGLEAAKLIWGMDPKLLAVLIVSVAYLIIFTERVNRAIVALLGAALMMLSGLLSQVLTLIPWLCL